MYETRMVRVGDLTLGGHNPVWVQSMTNTDTRDAQATLGQIRALAKAGCDIVRVSVYDEDCARAVRTLVDGSPVPLVADMSSMILSKPVDVTKYGCIYFGVQKNVAPAGMAIAIIRDDLLGKAADNVPTMMNYTTLINKDSMYNTPPCWCIYMTGLVLKYLENDIGGLANMQKINEAKAKVLYDYLDGQDFYNNPVEHRYRSTMNVTFTSPNPDMDKKFCAEAAEAGFVNLKGHRLVGGMRASIYNAMPSEGIDKLVDFMEKFRKANA